MMAGGDHAKFISYMQNHRGVAAMYISRVVLAVPNVSLEDVQPPADFAVLCLVAAHDTLSLGLVDHLRSKADGHTFLLRDVQRGSGTGQE